MSKIDILRSLHGNNVRELCSGTYCIDCDGECKIYSEYGLKHIKEFIAMERINECVIAIESDMFEDGRPILDSSIDALIYNLRNDNYIKFLSRGFCSIRDEYVIAQESGDIFILDRELNSKQKFCTQRHVIGVTGVNKISRHEVNIKLIGTKNVSEIFKISIIYNYKTKEFTTVEKRIE